MPDNNLPNFSENDPLDINELAALNNDISVDFIEQLQNKLSQKVDNPQKGKTEKEVAPEKPLNLRFDDSIDDNFIKKYKAKLNKQQHQNEKENTKEKKDPSQDLASSAPVEEPIASIPEFQEPEQPVVEQIVTPEIPQPEPKIEVEFQPEPEPIKYQEPIATEIQVVNKEIEELTSGSIIEKTTNKEQLDYNESLDFLDGNVKYSKYVIYIDPENTEFIDSLTVKERKNLINKILREQDDIALTKRRLGLVQTIIKHTIVAIITISISIPVVYYLINASLEASINNHRRSQSMFKTLLNEQGKLKKTPSSITK